MSRLNQHDAEDFYDVLQIEDPEQATEHDIRQNYKRLSLQAHPDKNLNDPNATARFQQIKQAYDTLIDPSQRRIYNISRKKTKTQRRTSRSSSHDSLDRASPSSWYDNFFDKNHAPRNFGYGRDPYITRDQRAVDRERATQRWKEKGDKLRDEESNLRGNMRTTQKETNGLLAREKEKAKQRAEEEDLRARQNMEERARASNQSDGRRTSDNKGAKPRIMFRNLPGSTCCHRMQWDKKLGSGVCQACGRAMELLPKLGTERF
ncbi:hypothetical protein GGR57DRAFT_504492 [Xylariaceae sp. FL1272]|nr:hypothetical protein GGR57DRAFT_504492 [Xylariaceae sp. FL1272]